jgi:hypothetical protein
MPNYITRITIDVLTHNEDARDDMMKVVQCIHTYEMAKFNITKETYYDALFGGKLSSIKTIDRIWRKVQEEKPNLRGKEWIERQILSGHISRTMVYPLPTLF